MIINNEIIRELALHYFDGSMPGNLQAYLCDRYGEEPLEGDLAPQFFFPAVISDIHRYLRGGLNTAVRTDLQKLQDRYRELSGIASSLAQDVSRLEKENRYCSDFIHQMNLYHQYLEFRKSAHEEQDVFGFPYYTL